MFSEFTNPEMLTAIVIGLSSLLTILYLDRYFTRRQSFIANSTYALNLHNGRKDSKLHWLGFENRRRHLGNFDLILGPEVEVRKPGFLSKRQSVTDKFGRVVATHYEELIFNDFQSQLMLNAGAARGSFVDIAA